MIGNPQTFIVSTIFLIPAIIVAIPVHELGHVFAAQLVGDHTPRRQGYLRSWRNWYEPYGIAAALFLRVGWGAAAPVNEYRLRSGAGKLVWALGGPVANLIVAIPFGIAARALLANGGFFDFSTWVQPGLGDLTYLVYGIFFLNLAFFAFQLLPIPGLDGWRILEALFMRTSPKFFFNWSMRRREIWGVLFIALFLSYFLGLNLLGWVMSPFFHPASALIMGGCAPYPGLSPCLP